MSWIIALAAQYLPALAGLRKAAFGVSLVVILIGGAWLVYTLRHEDETPRVERAARAIVERANLKAEVEQLHDAVNQSAETIADREFALAKSQRELAEFKKAQKDKRDASSDPNRECVPAGDPWFGRGGLRG